MPEISVSTFLICNIIAALCTMAVIAAVFIDFILYHKSGKVKHRRKSIVETGSMFAYFLVFYLLLRSGNGRIAFNSQLTNDLISVLGAILIVTGSIVNLTGRFRLKQQWANQIVIYQGHEHINSGIYSYLRHPLYASLIWMFIGASFIYTDYISLLSVIVIFIPMMYYRARLEEKLLMKEFPGYKKYIAKTGMFIPKVDSLLNLSTLKNK